MNSAHATPPAPNIIVPWNRVICAVRWGPGQTLDGYTWCGLGISPSVADEVKYWATGVVPDINCEDCKIATTRAVLEGGEGWTYMTIKRLYLRGAKR